MKVSTWPVIFSLAIFLFFSESAFARWQVKAVWQIGNGGGEYVGIGDSQGAALEAARQNCKNAQPLDEFKNYCLNAPVRTDYSQLPEGTYIKSCKGCRVNNNTLICDSCKPVLEERQLDLNTCNGNTDHIANCHGTLSCGEC